ncbi:MAG: hypothetical protein NTV98_03700, partial [Candidatus Roizmanbacteria bacterium]|nr:hypothetical protein [Candidatus Roizmanbacteria bacterium]
MVNLLKKVIDLGRKVLLVCTVFYIIIVVFTYFIGKNRPQINDKALIAIQQKQIYKDFEVNKLTKTTKMGKISLAIYRFTYCTLIGELCTDKPIADDSYFKTSLLGRVSTFIAAPYQYPPASGTYWVRNTLEKAGFIPQSYAAEGLGFTSIKPLMNLWTIFRDVAYLLIVLILVSIGFMIMFRMKLNPQTVISVENALPKIVVSLLLITFSFAIAGFLIDIMYLLVLLVINILSNGEQYYSSAKLQNDFLSGGPGILWEYILPLKNPVSFNPGIYGTILGVKPTVIDNIPFAREIYLGDALASIIPQSVNLIIRGIAILILPILATVQLTHVSDKTGITKWLDNFVLVGNGAGSLPQLLIGLPLTILTYVIVVGIIANGFGFFLGVVVTLTVTGMFFNILFILLRSYIQIIVMIVFSPIILLFEALPGKSTFSYWVKGLFGELMTFPLVITMLLVGKIMIATLSYPGDFWKAPFLGGLNTEGFGVIFGAGIIFLTPDIL